MSTWIHVTNLPLYYDEYGLQDIFSDIGQIIAMNVTKNEMILKSTGFVQFSNPKHAKLAASKKDQTVIGNSAIRVYLIWMSKEDLSTIKVENIPLNISTVELENNFIPYGSIVDITICKNNTTNDEKQDNNNTNNETYALISYCRVDYALQAVQEMNNTILGFGNPLTVNLVNPDARNLKWKRNSFEYKIIDIPPITHINSNQNQNYNRKHHRHHHHHHNNNNNNQQHHNSNPNIIIVNNIGSIHNNNDDSKHNDLLHPSYPYNKHRNRRHNRNNNNNNRYTHNNNNNNNNNNYEDDINNYHHHRQYRSNRNNNKRRKPRKYRGNNTRNNISSQSTLLGPLHNESNGQYRTYSVTPSPTRSNDNNNNNNNNNNYLNVNQISLQRMNSADSNSSNSSVQSVPNYNIIKSRGALESYGFPSKQIHQTHHSPQPYMSSNNNNNNIQTPVSPASTSGLSTPSTTHSMPTPTPPNNITYNNNNNMIHRSKTPTPLFHHNNIQTPTKSSTTPISALNTPPLPIPIPQIIPNMNIINSMNAMTINNIQNINNLNSHMNGIISPTSLMFPNLDTINKSPQSQTSPIVITPSQHNLLMQQQQQITNKNTLSPPNNTQSNFIYNSSPTLQGPFNNNIQPQKRFVFNNNTNNINNIPENNNNKKNKKSHNWTPKEEELGNKLYQIIRYNFPQRATKIVGMLLTANTIKDIEWMLQKPHILMAVANDYNQKQQKKELNKK